MESFLTQATIYLAAAVIAVPLAARLGLGSVLGYLAAGIVIGPLFGLVGSDKIPINEWLKALHADQPAQYRRSIWWSRALLAFHGSVLVIAIVTGLWVLPLIFSVFPFIANWLSYSVGLTQHCGLQENTPDFRKSVRSMTLNPVVEFLYWHMNWHIEHHMYAGVPCYNMKTLHKAVADDMPVPRTLVSAWREMLETWRRQQDDPDYFYDTPLPTSANVARGNLANELETSIGDLAPEELKEDRIDGVEGKKA